MKRNERYGIVDFINPSGIIAYRVTGRKPDGTRVRQNFKSLAEAIQKKAELETDAITEADAIKLRSTRLNETQLRDAEAAVARLGDTPLLPAVDFYLRNFQEPVKTVALPIAFQEFLAAKVRSRTVDTFKSRVGAFAGQHGDKAVSDVLPEHLDRYLHQGKISNATRNNNRRALSSFFGWCVKQGYCRENPVAKVDAIKVERPEPEILTVAEIERLMRAAETFLPRRRITIKNQRVSQPVARTDLVGFMVPHLALLFFSGIRPTELQQLTWDDIDLEEKLITISARIAKMRQRRHVEISDNLLEWLAPARVKGFEIFPPNWRKYFTNLRKEAKINHWPGDVARHSYVSYHLATHKNEGYTAEQAGNSADISRGNTAIW